MLSDKQLTELRQQIEAEINLLQERLRILERRLARDYNFNESEDVGDSAFAVLNKEEFLFEQNRVNNRLIELRSALKRIEDGSYGISEVSGKPIPLERLRAMPTATTLVGEKLSR
jgi:RNA polymerase-binding transcription factor DksA